MTTKEIERKLYQWAFKNNYPVALNRLTHLGVYKNLLRHNVNKGFPDYEELVYVSLISHECDFITVNDRGYLTEYEIKISKSDLKAESKKKHAHESDYIRQQYYVILENMLDCVDLIPEHWGIIIADKNMKIIRKPKLNKKAEKLCIEAISKLYRLANIRLMNTY